MAAKSVWDACQRAGTSTRSLGDAGSHHKPLFAIRGDPIGLLTLTRLVGIYRAHPYDGTMRLLWCWRCKAEMPMLDEGEFAQIAVLYSEAFKATKEFRQRWNIPMEHASLEQRFAPVRLRYEQLTGMRECPENAIMHHRLALYGPPCWACGKPLRTPAAKLCGSCMAPRSATLKDQ